MNDRFDNYELMSTFNTKKQREKALELLEKVKKLNRKVVFIKRGQSPSFFKVEGKEYIDSLNFEDFRKKLKETGAHLFPKTNKLLKSLKWTKNEEVIKEQFIKELKENNINFDSWNKYISKFENEIPNSIIIDSPLKENKLDETN